MTEITITQNFVEIKGHAGLAPAGFDIACAVVSTELLYLIESMRSVDETGFSYTITDGYARVEYCPDVYKDEIKTFRKMVDMACQEFPKQVIQT